MFLIYFLSFISLAAMNAAASESNYEMKLVQILFRHGDRTPVNSYPTDPYNESMWMDYGGFGQLTQTGMKQHYEFGQFLKKRYADFLNPFYSGKRALIRSTDYDRTLMSAYSLLNGLYPPENYQIWNNDTKWQPIPVHTSPPASDRIFYGDKCPRMDQLKEQVQKSDEYINTNKKYQDLFDVVNKFSGFSNMNLDDEWRIGDCLFVEKTHGLTLPDWAENIYDRLFHSLGWGFFFNYRLTEMAKLQSGGILNDMRKNIKTKVKSQSSNEIYLYSGHDTYVAAMTRLLNLTNYINQPPYASAVILELTKEINESNYFIHAYFKNNTANQPISFQSLSIYDCEIPCPLEKFLDITKDLVVEDFVSACKHQSIDSKNYYIIGALMIGLLVMGVTFSIALLAKKMKRGRFVPYSTL